MDQTFCYIFLELIIPRPLSSLPPRLPLPPFPARLLPFSPASALLLICNSLWDWLLQGRDSSRESETPASDADGGVGSGGMSLDAKFFERAMVDVNGIRGLGLRWSKKRVAAAAARAAASLRGSEVKVCRELLGPAARILLRSM